MTGQLLLNSHLGSDAGIHHVTEELPSNLEAKVREYKP